MYDGQIQGPILRCIAHSVVARGGSECFLLAWWQATLTAFDTCLACPFGASTSGAGSTSDAACACAAPYQRFSGTGATLV